ncbi:hypothetical protein PQI51_03185 [Microbacterium esteraromaticum]|uniref:hypothetical protein n=1 Tax=Microbacterium esteraromaticum TaxID=57043 RepID=UPI0030A5272B
MKISAPASNIVYRLPHPCAVDVEEPFDCRAGEVPRAGVESVVEVGDEVVLCEVEFDFAEQFGHHQGPQVT